MIEPVPVVEVEVLHDFVLRISFADGSSGDVDFADRLWGPVFEPLATDPQLFAQVGVDPEARTIVWPNGADIAPETLYRNIRAARAL